MPAPKTLLEQINDATKKWEQINGAIFTTLEVMELWPIDSPMYSRLEKGKDALEERRRLISDELTLLQIKVLKERRENGLDTDTNTKC